MENQGTIREFDGAPWVMGDDDEGASLGSLLREASRQVFSRYLVEAGKGFVQQKEAGTMDRRTGDGEALGHATGKGAGSSIRELEKRERVKNFVEIVLSRTLSVELSGEA